MSNIKMERNFPPPDHSPTAKCLTPDAAWTFQISARRISATVENFKLLGMTEARAVQIENDLHDAIAPIIAKHKREVDAEYGALKAHTRATGGKP